jgi:hypothetical protein
MKSRVSWLFFCNGDGDGGCGGGDSGTRGAVLSE